MHIAGDYFINVADAQPQVKPDGLLLYRFGNVTHDNYLKEFGAATYQASLKDSASSERFYRTRMLYNLSALTECVTYPTKTTESLDIWFPNIQLMASHSANKLFVAIHGGNNDESHNHNDVGDFMIYAAGYPIIMDVGRGTYTARTFSANRYDIWFNTSAYHNLPVVNGYQQSVGLEYAASDVVYNQKGKTTQLTLNIAGAYPKEAGITSWKRSVGMHKLKGIEIRDEYMMQTPLKSLTQSFMTVCETDLTVSGVIKFSLPDKQTAILTYDATLWKVSKEKISMGIPEEKGLSTSWNGKDIYRILLTAETLIGKRQIKYNVRF